LPSLRTIRSSTLRLLEQFAKAGGTIIFAGEIPSLVDAKPSLAPSRLVKRCVSISWTRRAILDALKPFREIELTHSDGSTSDSILHQIRIDGRQRHIFLCNMDREKPRMGARIRVRGNWSVTELDTMSGRTSLKHLCVE